MRKAMCRGAAGLVMLAGLAANAGADECTAGFVVVPDAASGRILAFDAIDGSLVDANFILDPGRLVNPIEAICSQQNTVLVADAGTNSILEYSLGGTFLRTIADASGNGLAGIGGIDVVEGSVLIPNAAGAWADTVQSIDINTLAQTTFASTGLNAPVDVVTRFGDVLVANDGSDDIRAFSLAGADNGVWNAGDLVDPLQITDTVDESVLGTSSTGAGVLRFDAGGALVDTFLGSFNVNGAWELASGNILFTGDDGVRLYDPFGGSVTDIVLGGDFRGVGFVVPAPSGALALAIGSGLLVRRRRG